MEISEFVRDTLLQIVQGMEGAQEKLRQTDPDYYLIGASEVSIPVDFDIAVTVLKSGETGAKASIEVFSLFKGEFGAKGDLTNSTVTRVKFVLPMQPKSKKLKGSMSVAVPISRKRG